MRIKVENNSNKEIVFKENDVLVLRYGGAASLGAVEWDKADTNMPFKINFFNGVSSVWGDQEDVLADLKKHFGYEPKLGVTYFPTDEYQIAFEKVGA